MASPPNGQKNGKKNEKSQKKLMEFKLNLNIRTIFIILFIILFLFVSFKSLSQEVRKVLPEKSITAVVSDVKSNKVKKVEVIDNKVLVYYKDNKLAITYKESNTDFSEVLKNANVDPQKVQITVKDTQGSAFWGSFIANLIPSLLIFGLLFFLFRQARGAQESVFSFGQSRAKRFNKDLPKTTFANVAGVDEAKDELKEVVDFLKNPDKYKKLGARTPKGVLLVGPAGCGKTLLAKAVAGEAGVPFFSIAGSEFMEMLVGIGAARVRDLFQTAKKSSPSIIFIDEIDAIGRARSSGVMPSHDEREQTLNQILVEMDGFTPNEQVIVMAATNRGDLLDSALLRPGRFDRRIIVTYPDLEGRKEIIKIHAKGKPFSVEVDWERVAKRTVGFSGADLENMLNEAAIHAAREGKSEISMENIEEAATKVKLGPEKKRLQTDDDKRLTAYHEAGHAIVSHFQPHTDPVHRISIVSRGLALGFTLTPPIKDKLHETKTALLEQIAVMLGGRAAEELVFSEITTGAANDFDQATRIARAMVLDYGMSALGPINLGSTMDVTEWGKSFYEQSGVSQETLAKADTEVKKILDSCYLMAMKIVKDKRKVLDKVAGELVKVESLDEDDFTRLAGPKVKADILQETDKVKKILPKSVVKA